jgi:hypothetical protein
MAQTLGKTPQQCCAWFDDLELFSKNLPKRPKLKSGNGQQQRKRRKAAQIERLYRCQEKYCHRSYGTEGALKMHIKLKHPSVTYNECYQQQARSAAAIMSQDLHGDEEESFEEAHQDSSEMMGDRSFNLPQDFQYLPIPPVLVHQAACSVKPGMSSPFMLSSKIPSFPILQGSMRMSPTSTTMVGLPFLKRKSPMDVSKLPPINSVKRMKHPMITGDETGALSELFELEYHLQP